MIFQLHNVVMVNEDGVQVDLVMGHTHIVTATIPPGPPIPPIALVNFDGILVSGNPHLFTFSSPGIMTLPQARMEIALTWLSMGSVRVVIERTEMETETGTVSDDPIRQAYFFR